MDMSAEADASPVEPSDETPVLPDILILAVSHPEAEDSIQACPDSWPTLTVG